jgi:hypothetical protein
MNADSLLHKVSKVFAEHHLEAIMVGNAAAVLHGAPVSTVDVDFLFRKTPQPRGRYFQAVLTCSDLFRVVNDDQGLQLDFMSKLHGIRSFEGLKARASDVKLGEHPLKVACLSDIIKSKRATGRSRDLAV